uniref:uroporphyrinogen decarboxylase family protein n=1 Tax=Staphylococcus epidermidis TaxID=1282 RepID=UPI0028CB1ADD
SNPIQTLKHLQTLSQIHPKTHLPYLLHTINLLTQQKLNLPLIPFTPPPFTLPSYIIHPPPSKNYNFTKPIIYTHDQTSFPLINHL